MSAGLKKFSNWPTYPQLYINGELIGGLDIIKVCMVIRISCMPYTQCILYIIL